MTQISTSDSDSDSDAGEDDENDEVLSDMEENEMFPPYRISRYH